MIFSFLRLNNTLVINCVVKQALANRTSQHHRTTFRINGAGIANGCFKTRVILKNLLGYLNSDELVHAKVNDGPAATGKIDMPQGRKNNPGICHRSRANAMAAIDKSLKRLRTDHIDLYQFHMPDPSTPIAETLEALNDMVEAGKIRLFGCSNLSPAQLREAIAVAGDAGLRCFVTAQDQWSVLDREIERDLVPLCAGNAIEILPYYPLAKGLLTGSYFDSVDCLRSTGWVAYEPSTRERIAQE